MIWNWIWNLNCSIWSLIWFIDRAAASTVLEPLKVLQKRAVRIVCGATYLAHTEPLYQRLNILKFENLYAYKLIISIHKGNSRMVPMFNLHVRDSIYNTRSQHRFTVPRSRIRSTDNTLSVRASHILNQLSQHSICIENLNLSHLKRILIRQQFESPFLSS